MSATFDEHVIEHVAAKDPFQFEQDCRWCKSYLDIVWDEGQAIDTGELTWILYPCVMIGGEAYGAENAS